MSIKLKPPLRVFLRVVSLRCLAGLGFPVGYLCDEMVSRSQIASIQTFVPNKSSFRLGEYPLLLPNLTFLFPIVAYHIAFNSAW